MLAVGLPGFAGVRGGLRGVGTTMTRDHGPGPPAARWHRPGHGQAGRPSGGQGRAITPGTQAAANADLLPDGPSDVSVPTTTVCTTDDFVAYARFECPGWDSNPHCMVFEAIACCRVGYRGAAGLSGVGAAEY